MTKLTILARRILCSLLVVAQPAILSVAEGQQPASTTAAPFVVNGEVFVGISGGDLGVRGRVT